MKGSAGHGSSLWLGAAPSLCRGPALALHRELPFGVSILTLAKMFSFLRYFSYLFPDTVSPASPLFLIRMTEVLFLCIIIVRNP